ncbi:uncharacterized protein RCC_08569 [Ramularia collo-cygni]|uniref:Spore coat protein SP96 n=1 Tax=Ramularia collo-cygni TaxID=112498 RepID=A0A2D3V4F7_9PEZI|nr:uncharacterized protein RCC_08569 [Ramularia collo-cygni]CZT22863.1 uncharacterized protein RCC_08569 [Ramularia collo-cygni]
MVFNMLTSISAILLLAGHATAHMIINEPVPFGKPTTSPLHPVKPGSPESDYPCQHKAGTPWDITTMNNMTVGVPSPLTFSGSATHAGGTCVLSITLDKEPTASSVFKTIKVFEGGCPSAPTGSGDPLAFEFTIPKGFPNGQATFAWLWYNKLGGTREVYMNCAPITISGGSDSKEAFDSLPNQYLINLPPSECQGVDSTDLIIPNPGKDVVKAAGAILKEATGPSCAAAAAAQTSGLSGYQTASPDSNSPPADSSASSTASEAQPTSAPASYGGGPSSMITIQTAAPSSMITMQTAAPAPSSPAVVSDSPLSIVPIPTISTAAPASSSPAGIPDSMGPPASYPTLTPSSGAGISGPGTTAGTGAAPIATGSTSSGSTCSTNGALVCNGASQFGLCNNGNVVWQAVAAGTTCSNGQIMKRSEFRHAHVRRHAQNGWFGWVA